MYVTCLKVLSVCELLHHADPLIIVTCPSTALRGQKSSPYQFYLIWCLNNLYHCSTLFTSFLTVDVLLLQPLPSTRYLVDQRWLKRWKKYTGYDSWDQYHAGNESYNPGPVDNADLLQSMLATPTCMYMYPGRLFIAKEVFLNH